MFWLLVGIFIMVPALELWGLITVGSFIGPGWTILLVIATGVLGSYLARKEGLNTYQLAMIQLRNNEVPTDAIIDGVMILLGGIMLITPGFLTDIMGFLLVIPYTRSILRLLAIRILQRKMKEGKIVLYRRRS
ncbi:FxsA family protein [Hazenella sp. IB182357]|uniref:FxsA family protein n=1 Tax=Polycladospora coralii TaxID=2771432 RepID=A0A926RUN2_9BACL|nr:FxsA family protein [Polycladospora coralii]MBD1372782.1 FxsA family protein [Polycladospora coralii]MBS7529520.1 FxsA family protein [Polycladospora coralii]